MGFFDLFKSKTKTNLNDNTTDDNLINDLKKRYIENKYDVIPYIPSHQVAEVLMRNTSFFGVLMPHKENMTYINDILIPGHIIMLWWLKETKRTQVPLYFIYEYGINFDNELVFLVNHGYVDENNTLTIKGEKVLSDNLGCVRNHKAVKAYIGDSIQYYYKDAESVEGIVQFESNGDFLEDQRLGSGYEKIRDYDNAILAYKAAITNARMVDSPIPPNPYIRLAIIYRKLNDQQNELDVIKEGIIETDYPQAATGHKKLVDRLIKLENANRAPN